jgi:predicted nucleotidyltransferase
MSVSDLIERFTAVCQADGRVVAGFLSGSHARAGADEYSDVDFGLVATDAGFESLWDERAAFVEHLGEPVFVEDFGTGTTVFFILADGSEGEVSFGRSGDFGRIHVGPYRPLVDKAGTLEGAIFPGRVADAEAQAEAVHQVLYWFWHELSHFIAALGRGELWWAAGQLEALRGHCVNLVRLAEGVEASDEPYEKVDAAVSPDRLAPLAATFVLPELTALLAAAKTVVAFYRERAPALAASHGVDYPAVLDARMVERLGRLTERIRG